MAKIIFSHEPTPAVPPAGTMVIYSKADRKVYSLDELGNDVPLTRDNLGTLAFQDGSSATIDGASTVDVSGGSLTLAADQVLWGWLNKAGSSLADLTNHNHSALVDDQPGLHRQINDAGTSPTELWSSQKISAEIATAVGITPYIVGKDPGDPYSSIQVAINDAVGAGATFTTPAVIIVKPGVFVENVVLRSGINVLALIYEKSFMTSITGVLSYDSVAGGSAITKVSTWVGIDVNGTGGAPALGFIGLNPQWLNITNCEVNSPGPAPACYISNVGALSTLVAKDVTFNQNGTAGDEGPAIVVESASIKLFKTEVYAHNFPDAIVMSNAAQIDSSDLLTIGRLTLEDTAGGVTANQISNCAGAPCIDMESVGSLLASNVVNIGSPTILSGSLVANVVVWPRAVTVPFDPTAIGYTATNVQVALEEMEKKEDALVWFEGINPPDFVNIDDYNFVDGASFAPAVDEDIIFRMEPVRQYQKLGVQLLLRYCMSTADTGTLRFRFDYRVKEDGDSVTGGTDYQSFFTFDPVDLAERVDVFQDFTVPSGRVTATTEVIHCRITRLGTDILDTHTGDFCLYGIGVIGS